MSIRNAVAAIACATLASTAHAQLRIVSMNASNSGSGSVGNVPQQVIVGANVGASVTVTNAAPVQFANGSDKLDYTISSSGSVSGGGSFTGLAALSVGNTHRHD
jgi:hypothetical protein